MAWINNFQVWLTESQSLKNAQEVVNYLMQNGKDWKRESISALIGNMRHESSVNPNMYEYGYNWSDDRGFGLVQWTPRSKYWNWGKGKGYTDTQLRSGNAQLARIDYEVENNIQWIAKDSVFNGLTFKEFRTNSRGLTVEQLTEAFTWGYERPNAQAGADSMPARKAFARRAYNELDWSGSGAGPEPDPDEPIPDPDPVTPDDPNNGIDLKKFVDDLNEAIGRMLTVDVVKQGNSEYYSNSYVSLLKQLGNTYKIKPNTNFYKEIEKKFSDFNGGLIPVDPTPDPDPDPGPDPEPEPSPGTKKFPVKVQGGINFWKRSKWGVGTLQRNMTYGVRSTGVWHYGYDIGGGGVNHTIHSVTNGTVVKAAYANGIGYHLVVKNDDDRYHVQYGHLKSFIAKVGDKVKAGDPVAVMGDTGGNYAIHLDVKISTTSTGFYDSKTTIDPEPYLGVTGDNQTSLPMP